MVRHLKPFLVFLGVLLLQSCEYEPPEKITEVDPDSQPPVLIELSLDFNSDTLTVCGLTSFTFNLETSNQPILGVIITCLDKTFTFEKQRGTFTVDPVGYNEGDYNLTMEVYTHSGTGSLADMIGSEVFAFSRGWTVRIEKPAFKKILFTGTSVENGFLKVQWQKWTSPRFKYYKIVGSDSALNRNYSKIIYDVNCTSFLDSAFVGGKAEFRLNVAIDLCDGTTMEYVSDKLVYSYKVSVTFEESADSLTIKWTDLPFNHTTLLSSNISPTRQDLGKAKSYSMRAPGLGNEIRYEVAFKPTVSLTWDHQMYYVYSPYTLGTKTDLIFYNAAYISELNSFFVKHPMYFRKYDGTTLSRLLSYDYSWDYYDEATIAPSSDRSSVFTTINQDIVQFNASTFEIISRKKFGPSETGSMRFNKMQIINDSLMYINYSTYKSMLAIYNYNSRKIIDEVKALKSSGAINDITISKDHRYIANCGNDSLKIYRNNDNTHLELIYKTSGSFLECIFDPVNIDNLLLITSDKAYVVKYPDMTLIYEIPGTIKGLAVNFDPVTNYLLFVSYASKTITVYDYINDIVKFKCFHHNDYKGFYLVNNTIYQKSGYNINIDYFSHAK